MASWAGTVFGVIGAIIVALRELAMQDVGYVFFTVGAVFSLYNAVSKKDASGIVLWGVFLTINIIGLFSYLK